MMCEKTCDFYKYQNYELGNRTIVIQCCTSKCDFGVQEEGIVKCELQCPSNLPYFNDSSKLCVSSCASNAYEDSSKEQYLYHCMNSCTKFYYKVKDTDQRYCVSFCAATDYYFGTECVEKCPSESRLMQDMQCVKQCLQGGNGVVYYQHSDDVCNTTACSVSEELSVFETADHVCVESCRFTLPVTLIMSDGENES